jgi:hypothetical protein
MSELLHLSKSLPVYSIWDRTGNLFMRQEQKEHEKMMAQACT